MPGREEIAAQVAKELGIPEKFWKLHDPPIAKIWHALIDAKVELAGREQPDTIKFALALLKNMENVELEHKAATTDLPSKDAYQLAANCLNLAHYEIARAAAGDPTTNYKHVADSELRVKELRAKP